MLPPIISVIIFRLTRNSDKAKKIQLGLESTEFRRFVIKRQVGLLSDEIAVIIFERFSSEVVQFDWLDAQAMKIAGACGEQI